MVFSSLNFIFLFLPLVIGLYYLSPRPLKNLILFLASLVFYAWGEPVYIVLMLFSSVVDYTHGLLVEKLINQGKRNRAKLVVASSMVINLALLGFFKYGDFVVNNINALFHTSIPPLNLPLPIGISFYTFQTMSYTIDVYRGDAKAQRNPISFGAYVTLFPQLVAGPIVRFSTVAEQLDHRRENFPQFALGVRRFVLGLGKKVLLANGIGAVWTELSGMQTGELSVLSAWIGALAYTFQIYFDFSVYSDMAIGLGQMFGFTFLENFNYPYTSRSITEFWRRWHISLGTWFKEYLYIPLGGNRKGLPRQLINISIVWLCTGIWHGASWNFVVWGVYYGILLICEKLFLLKVLERLPRVFGHIYTLFFVVISWVIFAFDSLGKGWEYIQVMFGFGGVPAVDDRALYLLLTHAILLVILILACTPLPAKIGRTLLKVWQDKTLLPILVENACLVFLFLLSTAYLVGGTYNPFLYFKF